MHSLNNAVKKGAILDEHDFKIFVGIPLIPDPLVDASSFKISSTCVISVSLNLKLALPFFSL